MESGGADEAIGVYRQVIRLGDSLRMTSCPFFLYMHKHRRCS